MLRILQRCIDIKAEKLGLLIHSYIITSGVHLGELNTKLIVFYAKFGNIVSARKVFDKMSERSVVSWTAMISAYSHNGFYEDALDVFLEMGRAGVKANQFTYGSVLRACTQLRCLDLGMQIQGCSQKGRFAENLFVESALVDLHSKCGKMEDACYLFEMMSERDIVSWNSIIGGYATQGLVDDSFHMFRSMMREGLSPDFFTLGSALRASAEGSDLMIVNQVHKFIIDLGFVSQNSLIGSLIDAYAKCGDISSAYHLYKSMLKKDLISCTSLITAYASQSKHSEDALNLFKEIIQMHLELDNVILCSMLNMCANAPSLSMGMQIHALAIKSQQSFDVALGNALIDMYAKAGEVENAKFAFDEMGEKNVISWTSLISGYGKHGYGDKAIALYKKMDYVGLRPNDVTFLSLLFACSHSGLTGEGQECFENMVRKYNILPRAEHFSCMVDLFARGGFLEEAYNMMCEMNIKPNASLWGSILGACNTYCNVPLAELAATHLFNLDPDNSANYVVLASIYAAAGAWENACETRNLMQQRLLKKDRGYSLLQSTKKSMALLQPN